MDTEDQEADNNFSSLNVPLEDAQAMEIRAMDMKQSTNAEEGESLPSSDHSKEVENGALTQDGPSASQQSLHQCHDSTPAQINSEQEGLNEGKDAADDASIESTEKKEGLVEGEVPVQVEQESDAGINEGESAADDASAESSQKDEGLPEGNGPDQFKQEPDVDCKEGEYAANDASMSPMQQEVEFSDGEDLRQVEQEVVVTMDEGDKMRKEREGTGSDEIEQDPVLGFNEGQSSVVDASKKTWQNEGLAGGEAQAGNAPDVGLHEGECAADDASMHTLQKEEGSAEGEGQAGNESGVGLHEGECAADDASTLQKEEAGLADGEGQAGNESDVGLYEGECAADDASTDTRLDEVPIQNVLEPEVELNEGECAADDVSMDTVQDEVPVQNEVEPGGVNEGDLAADEAFMNISHEEEGVGAFAGAALNPCGVENSIAIDPSTSGESSPEEEPQERCEDVSSSMTMEYLQDDGVAVVEDEYSEGDNHACDAVEGDVDPLPSELPSLKGLTERDYLQLNEVPTISMVDESVLIKEPSLCTPAMEALIDACDQPLGGDEKREEMAAKDGFSSPADSGLETSENGNFSEEKPSSDADWMLLKASDIGVGAEVHSGDESDGMGKELGIEPLDIIKQDVDEPVEETVEIADVEELKSVPPPGNRSGQELGIEALVIQQAREGDGEVAVPLSSMVQENGFLQHSEAYMNEQHHTTSANAKPFQDEKVREIGRSLGAPQQEEDSKGVKQEKHADYINGNAAIMHRRTTCWGCCGMLDLFLHKD